MKILTALTTLCFFGVSNASAQEVIGDVERYDIQLVQSLYTAANVIESAGLDLSDYDVVLRAELENNQYVITFTDEVYFAEDGEIRGPTVRVFFDSETDSVVGFIVLN